MESKLFKEISTYCRLNFSNQLIKQPKPLFYPKSIPQKPINFRKKCQKKSIKYLNADHKLDFNKNPQLYPYFERKESQKRKINLSQKNHHQSIQKQSQRIQFKNQHGKIQMKRVQQIKEKFHKSLQRQPMRKEQPNRNIIDELKNYKFKIKQKLTKGEPLENHQMGKNQHYHSSVNLNKTANLFEGKMFLQEDKSKAVSTSFIKEKDHLIQISTINNTKNSSEKILCSPVKEYVDRKATNGTFNSPLKMRRVPQLERTPIICVSEPQALRKNTPKVNFTTQNNQISYSQKFSKIYGRIDIQDSLKKDLITSLEMQSMKSRVEGSHCGSGQYIKQSESQKSTVMNSELKLKKINSESDVFDGINISKKSYFGESYSKTEQKIDCPYNTKEKGQTQRIQSRTQQNIRYLDSIEMQNEDEQNYNVELTEKCERRQNFRSIVSVHSQCGSSSSESQDSIIINNHPKEIGSLKPIRTLF